MGSVDSERPERFYGGFLHGNLVAGRKSTKMKTNVISVHDAMRKTVGIGFALKCCSTSIVNEHSG